MIIPTLPTGVSDAVLYDLRSYLKIYYKIKNSSSFLKGFNKYSLQLPTLQSAVADAVSLALSGSSGKYYKIKNPSSFLKGFNK